MDESNRELAGWIASAGLTDRVKLLGPREDVPRLDAALAAATLSAAFGEAFPLVIGEAMACGVPCVATDVGDSARMIGETGRVVPPGDSEALAVAWEAMLAISAEDRADLGRAARRRIAENYSLATVTARYRDVYEALKQETAGR